MKILYHHPHTSKEGIIIRTWGLTPHSKSELGGGAGYSYLRVCIPQQPNSDTTNNDTQLTTRQDTHGDMTVLCMHHVACLSLPSSMKWCVAASRSSLVYLAETALPQPPIAMFLANDFLSQNWHCSLFTSNNFASFVHSFEGPKLEERRLKKRRV